MEFVVKCEHCGKRFANFSARGSHIKFIHERPPTCHQCTVCLKRFRDSYSLKRHLNSMHEKDNASEKCPVCELKIAKRYAPQHFQQHGITVETETLILKNGTAFEQWKTQIEKETNSRFVKRRPGRTMKQGVIVTEYCCNRSGYFRPKGQGLRALKLTGSNKINGYCPAAIKTQLLTSGEVIATFNKTHVGHINEVGIWEIPTICEGYVSDNETSSLVLGAEETVVVQQLSSQNQTKETDICHLEERKVTLIEKFSEMVKAIKSNSGLDALERHIAPLQSIINSAEKQTNEHLPQVLLIVQEPPIRKLSSQRVLSSTKKISVRKKPKLGNPSSSECDKIAVSMIAGQSQDHTIDLDEFLYWPKL